MDQPNIPHHFDQRATDYPRRKPPRYGWRDDNGQPIHAIDQDGNPICGRRCSTTGEPCKRTGHFLAPNGRCVTVGHGGKAVGAPLKHGRCSIFLPTRLAAAYEEAAQDDVLLNVRDSISIISAMIQDKFVEMGEEPAAVQWLDAKIAFKKAQIALHANDFDTLHSAFDTLGSALEAGSQTKEREKEAIDLMSRAGKLTKIELARLEKMQHLMTKEQAAALQAQIISVLRKHLDPPTLSKVSHELSSLSYGGNAARPLHVRNSR